MIMKVKIIFSVAFVTNILLGNICMMPMAMAAEMPQHEMNEMEEVMTPMAPMSHADCPDCPHHEEKGEPAQQSSSCAGHCLSQATSVNPANLVFGSAQLAAALPAVVSYQWSSTENSLAQPNINPSPPLTSTDSVVLRL